MHKSSRDFYLIKRYDYTFFKRSFLQKILQIIRLQLIVKM
ncbi:hypothetical protein F542_6110 [Bibersteinia trehalosi USDA-ARS-USMARC-188]|uniref:Uncharacterized protein n=1 Tax=Bibersteinia trehalosi USDA-ARS-USMARC-188 TaxID=1263829 RepID=A0A4V7I8I0_BIBTR|nr:hypothetical protein F542_6110 [Bibersteinia trehalosi USDA-ARS-USMARC-188]